MQQRRKLTRPNMKTAGSPSAATAPVALSAPTRGIAATPRLAVLCRAAPACDPPPVAAVRSANRRTWRLRGHRTCNGPPGSDYSPNYRLRLHRPIRSVFA